MDLFVSLLLLVNNGFITSAFNFNMDDVALVLRAMHPLSCPPNELWLPCTSNCTDCARRRRCPSECLPGCDCVPRYFRIEPGGPCVPVAHCPRPECGANEVFRECGPVCERCGSLRCRMVSCEHKCYCKEGHLRNEEGQCIPRQQCPKRSRCSRNEEWSESGPSDEYCLRQEGEEASNATTHEPGCYCKQGFRRNTYGSCVASCDNVACQVGAVYHACVPKCRATCGGDASCEEDGQCYPGCFCPDTHRMDAFDKCVPKDDCSTDIPEVKIVHGSGIMGDESSETTPGGESIPTTPEGKSTTATPGGEFSTTTPGGKSTTVTPSGKSTTVTPSGKSTTVTPGGKSTTASPGLSDTDISFEDEPEQTTQATTTVYQEDFDNENM